MNLTPDQSRLCAESLRNIFLSPSNNLLDPETKLAALSAWAKHPDPQLTDWMLEHYDTETPAMRSAMFQVFRSSPERLNRWLDAMENGTLSNNRIDANQIQALKQVQGEAAPRIEKLLAGRIQSDRQTLFENVMKELTAQGLINTTSNTSTITSTKTNRENGKQLFAQHCAACHRIDNVGVNLGPDISDSRTQSPAQLLVSILDPNRAIDNQYFRVSVRMLDGSVYDGIIREESSQHILLNTQQQPNVSLPKSQIETLVSSGKSLMPEGFEAQLNNAAIADLIDYIKNWRYAP
jgi:putative heme-binding domain-containing protein